MARPKVLLIEHMYDPAGEALLHEHADVRLIENASPGSIMEAVGDVNGICVRYPAKLGADAIEHAKRTGIVATSGRGTDAIDLAAATQHGIAVVNNPGFGPIPVSEHALALIFALTKHVLKADRLVREGVGWDERLNLNYHELHGRTLGVIGLGAIGSEMVRKCIAAFSMKVLTYDPYVPESKATALGATMVKDLDELLAACDIVSMHPELSDTARGMIGEAQLRRMQKHALLINTARGKVVQQAALAKALAEGWIAGAALDVFEDEPPSKNNPLYRFENCIMSPHMGGLTVETNRHLAVSAASQVLQALRGERPPHVVNPAAWDRAAARIRSLGL